MMKCKFNNLLTNGKKVAWMALVMASLNAYSKNQPKTELPEDPAKVEVEHNKRLQDVGPVLLTMGVIIGLTWLFSRGANNEAQRKVNFMKEQQNQKQR